MSKPTRIFFVTDLHGSNVCFKKVLNSIKTPMEPDVLIIGADITGKYLVPIVEMGSGRWHAVFQGESTYLEGERAVAEYEEGLANGGGYSVRCSQEMAAELASNGSLREDLDKRVRTERLAQWVELADARLRGLGKTVLINGGNDDPWYIDEILDRSETMIHAEGKVVELDGGLTVISTGLSNLTPWRCPRDVPESKLQNAIEGLARQIQDFDRCLFNFHCPPFDSGLDRAPRLDENLKVVVSALGVQSVPVGSTAVRDALRCWQPAVGLHGHVHEEYAYARIGKSLCFNPGSEYAQGLLRGVFLEFREGRLERFGLTREQ